MTRVLMLAVAILLVGSLAFADHIAPYSDATGSSCNLPAGFSTNTTIIHKFTAGATGSRWKLDLSLAPGSLVFAFNTPYVPIGVVSSDLSLGYGQCLVGSIPLGTVVAILNPGAVSVVPADAFPNIIYTNCLFAELPATGGHASINGDGHGCDFDAVEKSTWGSVKALYR